MHELQAYIKEYTGQSQPVDHILDDKGFEPYFLAPDYISAYLKHFSVNIADNIVRKRMTLFYIWLKSMDRLIDQKLTDGYEYYKLFINPTKAWDFASTLTIALSKASCQVRKPLSGVLKKLNKAALQENESKNIKEFIARKRKCGRLCAEATLILMDDIAEFPDDTFRIFFLRLGSVSQLLDAAIDFKEDYKNGEIQLRPTLSAYLILYSNLFIAMSAFIIRYPFILQGMGGFIARLYKGRY